MQGEGLCTCCVRDGRFDNKCLLARAVDILWTCVLRQKNCRDDKMQGAGRHLDGALCEFYLISKANVSVARSLIS